MKSIFHHRYQCFDRVVYPQNHSPNLTDISIDSGNGPGKDVDCIGIIAPAPLVPNAIVRPISINSLPVTIRSGPYPSGMRTWYVASLFNPLSAAIRSMAIVPLFQLPLSPSMAATPSPVFLLRITIQGFTPEQLLPAFCSNLKPSPERRLVCNTYSLQNSEPAVTISYLSSLPPLSFPGT